MRPYAPHILARVSSMLDYRDRLVAIWNEHRVKAAMYATPNYRLDATGLTTIPSEADDRWTRMLAETEQAIDFIDAKIAAEVETSTAFGVPLMRQLYGAWKRGDAPYFQTTSNGTGNDRM